MRGCKYLGSTVIGDGGSSREVDIRIQAGWNSRRKVVILFDGKISPRVKDQLLNTMIRPAVLYGMDTVVVTKGQRRQMQVAAIKTMRLFLGLTKLGSHRLSQYRQILDRLGSQTSQNIDRYLTDWVLKPLRI